MAGQMTIPAVAVELGQLAVLVRLFLLRLVMADVMAEMRRMRLLMVAICRCC